MLRENVNKGRQMQAGFDCSTCSTFHPFSVYVLAHRRDRLVHRCPVCNAEHNILEGHVTMKKPGDPAKANPPDPQPAEKPATMEDLFDMAPAGPTMAELFDLKPAPTIEVPADNKQLAAYMDGMAGGPTIADLIKSGHLTPAPPPWQPITATYPFEVDPMHDRAGWYEFVPRMGRQLDVTRFWWNGDDWQTGPDGSPGDMRYDGFIGWRGLLAQAE